MIHDATVEVTCDREGCCESVVVDLEWVYCYMAESSGFYDSDESKVEGKLRQDHEWTVSNGKHFCSPEHAEPAKPEPPAKE